MSKDIKLDRKELKKPDEFVSKGRAIMNFIQQRQRRFITVLVITGFFILAIFALDRWSKHKLVKNWIEFYEITKMSETEKWGKLQEFIGGKSMTRPVLMATIELADHYVDKAKRGEKKDLDFAIELYSKVLQSGDLLPEEKQLVYYNRATLYEMNSKYDEALKDYQLASEFSIQNRALVLISIGHLYETMNNKEKAIEFFNKVINDFVDTEFARIAKNSLRRLESPIFKDGS